MRNELGGVSAAALSHFRERWGIDKNLYEESIKHSIRRMQDTVTESFLQLTIISGRGGK
jgi:hypothetical protein